MKHGAVQNRIQVATFFIYRFVGYSMDGQQGQRAFCRASRHRSRNTVRAALSVFLVHSEIPQLILRQHKSTVLPAACPPLLLQKPRPQHQLRHKMVVWETVSVSHMSICFGMYGTIQYRRYIAKVPFIYITKIETTKCLRSILIGGQDHF